jgi:hypothetical protein
LNSLQADAAAPSVADLLAKTVKERAWSSFMAAADALAPEETMAAAVRAVEALKVQCEEARDKLGLGHVAVASKALATPAAALPRMSLRVVLKGHFGKVYALAWANDSKTLVTAR